MLAGCGGAKPPSTSDSSGNGYFPITQTSVYGEVTVPSEPKRIVLLSSLSDFPLVHALGLKPVAVQWWGNKTTAEEIFDQEQPWLEGRLDLTTVRNDLLGTDGKAVPEAILALQPDLIIGGIWSVPDKAMFDQLAAVAPTWVGTREDGAGVWRDRIVEIATLTGRLAQAERATDEVEGKLAAARAELVGVTGKTYQYAFRTGAGSFSMPGMPGVVELGLAPGEKMPVSTSTEQQELSLENLDQFNADVLILAYTPENEAQVRAIANDPRFRDLPAVRNNAVFFVDAIQAMSLAWMPGSTDWMIDYWVPQLKKTGYYTGR